MTKKKKYALVWVNEDGIWEDGSIDTMDWEFATFKDTKRVKRNEV